MLLLGLIALITTIPVAELVVPFGTRLVRTKPANFHHRTTTAAPEIRISTLSTTTTVPPKELNSTTSSFRRKASFENMTTFDQWPSGSNHYLNSINYKESSSTMAASYRQPVLIDSVTALSQPYSLPPLTAALPMEEFTAAEASPHHSRRLPSVSPVAPSFVGALNHGGNMFELHEQSPPFSSVPKPVSPSPTIHPVTELAQEGIPGIPGHPWKDYPLYRSIPDTHFDCHRVKFGFYADVEAGCQVWHYCQLDGRQDSFLCPNGTLFNQATRVCDWWYNVDCHKSISKYSVNEDLYRIPRPEPYPSLRHATPAPPLQPKPDTWSWDSLGTYRIIEQK